MNIEHKYLRNICLFVNIIILISGSFAFVYSIYNYYSSNYLKLVSQLFKLNFEVTIILCTIYLSILLIILY